MSFFFVLAAAKLILSLVFLPDDNLINRRIRVKILALNGFRGVEVTAVETNVHIRVKQRYDEVS